jgi:hypothetical protein
VIELLLEAERALSFGRVDRAEEIYRQVVESDPRNSIAVVGLARVALERTDDLGAYLLARRALRIDPENDAALRLAARLEEVLATRGEPVEDPLPQHGTAPRAASTLGSQEPRDVDTAPPEEPRDVEAAVPEEPGTAGRPRRSLIDRLRRR